MVNRISGTQFNDFLEGTDGNDLIRLGGGRDSSDGLGGNDTLFGGADADRLRDTATYATAGTFTDELYGGVGDDVLLLHGRAAGDFLQRVSVSARLQGGEGGDQVRALIDMSDSFVVGGESRLSLHGNNGDDRLDAFVITTHATGPLMRTLLTGGAGDDLLSVYSEARVVATSKIAGENHVALYGGEGSDVISARALQGFPEIFAGGGDGDDRLDLHASMFSAYGTGARCEGRGGNGDDLIRATVEISTTFIFGSSANLLRGGGGNDTIEGEATDVSNARVESRSSLYGDGGDDMLTATGGSGNLLDGGAGADTLTGSAFADRFVLGPAGGLDVITNFQPGLDVLDAGDLPPAALSFQSSAARGGTLVLSNGQGLALLQDVYDLGDLAQDVLLA